ncbi:MAG: hydrogenase maturation protease [Cyclobacteriaceae bacterium]|nr:hydrogenase maturation protease [Cyclobacteriaceae bacterium]
MIDNHPEKRNTLILGIGNLLMGDEGIGVHVVRELENKQKNLQADIIDGGTGGFHLLSLFEEYKYIIMVDATMDGQPEGTISLIEPRFSSDFPRALTAHDIGLKDLVESAIILGKLPKIYLITVSITEIQLMKMVLSKNVKASIPEVFKKITNILQGLNGSVN